MALQVANLMMNAETGFVIYWALSFVAMTALGLPVENIQNAFGKGNSNCI